MDQVNTSSRVPAQTVAALIADALASAGLPPADAAEVADLMLEADLTGADAHGVFRLPQYVKRLRAGGVNPSPPSGSRKPRRRPRWSTATTAWAIW
jgi:LDH2 family malate/lactate/ureidoglycolate dehydrogenase